jgi:hypothetical protein
VLRPNPKVPNLFRREDQNRQDRYRCNLTIEEALESMQAARGDSHKRQKFVR